MTRQAAMLRGVNLGKRTIVMSELRAACEEAGFTSVETLLASGNVVLASRLTGPKLEAKLEVLILEAFGIQADVFVRTAAELEGTLSANPFKAFAKTNPSFLLVNFMRAPTSAAEIAAMSASALDGEQFRQGVGCLYLKYPKGQGQSRFRPPKHGTARNWNTVMKLAAMAAE
jgi:uncharacterized protein (DUF1697 family)